MDSGSMQVKNSSRGTTVFTISKNLVTAVPVDNAIVEAQRALKLEEENPSPNSAHITFLKEWMDKYHKQQSSDEQQELKALLEQQEELEQKMKRGQLKCLR